MFLGLALRLASAAPEYGGIKTLSATTEQKIVDEATRKSSTSDNSSYVQELGYITRSTHYTEPNICMPSAGLRKLKTYRTATCSDGTKAHLALYDAPGCVGEPTTSQTVEKDMLEACLDMPSPQAGSYAFWYTDDIGQPGEKSESSDPSQPENSGSILGLIGILLLIFASFLLIAILKLLSFISRATNAGDKFLVSPLVVNWSDLEGPTLQKGIFGKRDGATAL